MEERATERGRLQIGVCGGWGWGVESKTRKLDCTQRNGLNDMGRWGKLDPNKRNLFCETGSVAIQVFSGVSKMMKPQNRAEKGVAENSQKEHHSHFSDF